MEGAILVEFFKRPTNWNSLKNIISKNFSMKQKPVKP
jgi:hypothetical protein